MRRRKTSTFSEARRQLEERRARHERLRAARREAAARGAALQGLLSRPPVTAAEAAVRRVLAGSDEPSRHRELLHAVLDQAPRLITDETLAIRRTIAKGDCAIWTLLEDDAGHWRRLTVEVRPSLRAIAQARGRLNRMPEAQDMVALNVWAGRNNLKGANVAG